MEQTNDKIDLTRQIKAIKLHWYYYIIALILFMCMAIAYIYIKNPVYVFHSTVLIESGDDEAPKSGASGGIAQMMRTFSFGGMGSASVDNELLIMQSHSVILKTVKELALNISYFEKEGFKKNLLHSNSPIKIIIAPEILDTLDTSLKCSVKINASGKVNVILSKGLFSTLFEVNNSVLPITIKSIYGDFIIAKTDFFRQNTPYDIQIAITSYNIVTQALQKKVLIDYSSKKSDGIELEVKESNKKKGEDILNTIMNLYNSQRLDRKNQKAEAEMLFINERISRISKELSDVEKSVETFKSANNLSDIESEAKVLLEQNSLNRQSIVTIESQLSIIKMVVEFLNDPKNQHSLVPMSEGLNDKASTEIIKEYNNLIIYMMELNRSAKSGNIEMASLKLRIDAMRDVVSSNVRRTQNNTLVLLNGLKNEDSQHNARLKQLPRYEREYFNLLRSKALKNDLYMFLLERHENCQLKLSSNIPPGFIIDKAYSETGADPTRALIAIAIALFMTIFIPTVVIFYRMCRQKKIRFSCDIPSKMASNIIGIVKSNKNQAEYQNGYINIIRKIRAKALADNENKVIRITSTHINEGRTNICCDIAQQLSYINKRIIIIDIDVNSPKIAEYYKSDINWGINDYIENKIELKSIIYNSKTDYNIDFIGTTNADRDAEDIVLNDKFESLIETLNNEYDFVIVRYPIYSKISNIKYLNNASNTMLYIVKPGVTQRNELKVPYNDLKEKMHLLLIGVKG